MQRFLCGVPNDACCGAITQMNSGLRGKSRAHASRIDAFKCHQKYLLANGYTKMGTREFIPPDGGPIMIMDRKNKFGGVMRQGKSGSKSLSGGNRFMPKHLCKHNLAGIILGTS